MEQAFWDSSALVPLCVEQQATSAAVRLIQTYDVAVWWAAPVEMRAAFARLLRSGQLTQTQHVGALVRMDSLRGGWMEVVPSAEIRETAEQLPDRFVLKAADALQLAAALAWCRGKPSGKALLSGDKQLLAAADGLGFHTVTA